MSDKKRKARNIQKILPKDGKIWRTKLSADLQSDYRKSWKSNDLRFHSYSFLFSLICFFQISNDELAHLQHGLHPALRFDRV